MNKSSFIPKKVYTILNLERPDGVFGQRLTWRMRVPKNSGKTATHRLGTPTINSKCDLDIETQGMFMTKDRRRPAMEIDLGATRMITALSTQGGCPPIRKYPHIGRHNRVEGIKYHGKYEGPFWNVVDPNFYFGQRRSKLR